MHAAMKRPSAANNNKDVVVDIPGGNDNAAATDEPPDNNFDGEESASRQRSLLKTLWSEATSTTDLPLPRSPRLHHRRTINAAAAGGTAPSKSARKASKESAATVGVTTPSKRRGNARQSRYRISRGAKIAKRVWLAAFAAFAASLLIAIHIFLYRVFIGSNRENSGDNFEGSLQRDGRQILAVEDLEVKMTLAEAHSHKLSPINAHSIDTTQYTIRMNTWQRNEQLLLSINHHAQCEGVKEIQIVWCDNNEPPDEIVHHSSGKVKIEKHVINSLNERFKVFADTPTLGILSLDDDVMRPCTALDAAFVRWIRNPERMVGFDARTHVIAEKDDKNSKKGGDKTNWKYGYMSTTESSNQYSMTLPRASFIHRDYLDLYPIAIPRPIYKYVAQNLECEDIAMSFFVSSLTNGKPPLLADYWAVKSMVKLYSAKKISGGKGHKSTRDTCVNDFAELLGIKENGNWPLHTEKLLHSHQFFGYGAEPEDWAAIDINSFSAPRLQDLIKNMQALQLLSGEEQMRWLTKQKALAAREAKEAGMIEKTEEWKNRWGKVDKGGE